MRPARRSHVVPEQHGGGYGGFRLLTNAILTHGPIQGGPLLIALAWLTGAAVAATLLFRHNTRTARRAHSAVQAGRVTG